MHKRSFAKAIVIPAIFAAIGLVLVLISIGTATIWKPASTISAQMTSPDNTVVTRPGVLSLVDHNVKIQATAPNNGKVSIVVGRSADVIGWAAPQAWAEITGIENSKKLTFEKHAASAPKNAKADSDNTKTESPLDSNMWIATASGNGKAELNWAQTDGQYSAMVVSTTGKPTVTLQWHANTRNPYFVPLLTIGIIMLLLAALSWFIMRISAQRQQLPEETENVAEPEVERPTVIQLGEAVAPSRRALREARERGEAAIIVGDKEYPTGLIPVVQKVAVAEKNTDESPTTESSSDADTTTTQAADADLTADSATATQTETQENTESNAASTGETTSVVVDEAPAQQAQEDAESEAATSGQIPVTPVVNTDKEELARIAASVIAVTTETEAAPTNDSSNDDAATSTPETTPIVATASETTVSYEEPDLSSWTDMEQVTTGEVETKEEPAPAVENTPVNPVKPGLRSYDDNVTLADFEVVWNDEGEARTTPEASQQRTEEK